MDPLYLKILATALTLLSAVLLLTVLVMTYKLGYRTGWHECSGCSTNLEIDGEQVEDIMLEMLRSRVTKLQEEAATAAREATRDE